MKHRAASLWQKGYLSCLHQALGLSKICQTYTNHEAFVPGFDLLFREVGVVHQELHVLLGKFLAPRHAHRGCLPSQQHQQYVVVWTSVARWSHVSPISCTTTTSNCYDEFTEEGAHVHLRPIQYTQIHNKAFCYRPRWPATLPSLCGPPLRARITCYIPSLCQPVSPVSIVNSKTEHRTTFKLWPAVTHAKSNWQISAEVKIVKDQGQSCGNVKTVFAHIFAKNASIHVKPRPWWLDPKQPPIAEFATVVRRKSAKKYGYSNNKVKSTLQ